MMEELPLDTTNPVIRDYLALIRLQVLTPLSLLVNITAVLVCSLSISPGIQDIEKMFPSSISPKPLLIASYLLLVYVGQVGYCILLVTARKPETKKNHKKRSRHCLGTRQLAYGVLGRRVGHAMVLGVDHPPRHIIAGPAILQRRYFNLPPP